MQTYLLSMANAGRHTFRSQFFITTGAPTSTGNMWSSGGS